MSCGGRKKLTSGTPSNAAAWSTDYAVNLMNNCTNDTTPVISKIKRRTRFKTTKFYKFSTYQSYECLIRIINIIDSNVTFME